MKYALWLVLLAAAVASSCVSVQPITADLTAPKPDESIFVIGVTPSNYRLFVMQGSVEDGRFRANGVPAIVGGAPRDGYIVGKAAAGRVLAITEVRRVNEGSGGIAADLRVCGGATTMVFAVPKGKIVYIGSAAFQQTGRSIDVTYSRDLEAARQFVRRNFPKLDGAVEAHPYGLMPTWQPCGAAQPFIR